MAAETLNARYEIIETAPDADTLPFTVAKARDVAEGRVVTLQTLPARRISANGVAGPTPRAAFTSAVQQAGRLDHANVARLYDQGAAGNGDLFVASEYIRGITLKERIRRIAPFSLSVAADIAVAVAEALEYAHAAGVVHGDLRPHQVLLSPEGQIKVVNFAYGRAAALLAGAGPDPLYAAYAAPEQGLAAGLPAGTVAADLYALGASLYEMLTGALPPQGAEGPPSPRSLNPGVPPALEGVVQKALHPDPAARYRSAAPLLADLRAVREALRTGRSLAWSPVADKRVPRPAEARFPETHPPDTHEVDTVVTPSAPDKPERTLMGDALPLAPAPAAPDEKHGPDEEYERPAGRAASRALSITLAALFVIAVLGIIGLSWYAARFLAIPDDVQVPNLIGKTFDDAQRLAAQQHFHLTEKDPETPHYSTRWPENQIYAQEPPPGRTIKAGRDVSVVRSAGPPQLRVPDLSGMNQERATHAVQDSGLPLGNDTDDYSDTVPQGMVLSQAPARLAMVPRNTPVNFVVSRGKQPPDTPEDLSAQPSDPSTIALSWKRAARADSYTVSRAQEGSTKTVAQDVKDTHITDSGLAPQTTYTYTVTSVGGGGSSGPGEPVTAVTPPLVPAPPVPDPNALPSPAAPDSGAADSGYAPRARPFTIEFRVPRHPRRDRHVQFEVQDATGLSQPYDEYRQPGDRVQAPIQAFGNRVTIRIFLDGKLQKQQTL